ncbi:hypothetical protein D3C72_2170490 [compost metagenome]
MNRPISEAQRLPGGNLPGKDLRQLHGTHLRQWVVGVNDYGDAIQADDLFGGGTVEVTQRLHFGSLARLDRA